MAVRFFLDLSQLWCPLVRRTVHPLKEIFAVFALILVQSRLHRVHVNCALITVFLIGRRCVQCGQRIHGQRERWRRQWRAVLYVPSFLGASLIAPRSLHVRSTDYIGTWPEKRTIAVAHQGTDPTQLYLPFPPIP